MDAALVTTNRYAREALNQLLSAPGDWVYEADINPRSLKSIDDALIRWVAAGVVERSGRNAPAWARKVRVLPHAVCDADITRARIERLAPLLHARDRAVIERDRIQTIMAELLSQAAAVIHQPPIDDELAADGALFPLTRRHREWHEANRDVYGAQCVIDDELQMARERGEDVEMLIRSAMALPVPTPRGRTATDAPLIIPGDDPLGTDG